MVWNYNFASNSFDLQLLKCIMEKNDEHVESTLRNAENLCTAVDSSGASLLHYAAEYGNETVTKLLIEWGAKIDLQDQEGRTPLILATRREHEETVRYLLENDADMYVCDKSGVSALELAVHETPMHPVILELFLDEIINACTSRNSLEIAKRLLKVNCPLYIAVRLKNTDVLKCMLSEGSPIDAEDPTSNRTALHVAVQNLDFESVKFLVGRGANVNALDVSKQTPLSLIRTFNDRFEETTWMEVFERERTPGEFTEEDIIEILVNNKTELTTCTKDGVMQIYWVLTCGYYESIDPVVESKVDLQARDSHGRTVIHYLANNTNCSGTGGLDCRIRKHTKNKLDKPRKKASRLDCIRRAFEPTKPLDPEIVRKVESEIVDWNARDKDGRTALHHAMAAGNTRFVRYLISKGANVNVEDNNGVTPFFAALESSMEESLEGRVVCMDFIMGHGVPPAAGIERYFEIYRTRSAINRHFALLKPALKHLVLRRASGEDVSEKILSVISTYSKLKDYVDLRQKELDQMKINKRDSWKVKLNFIKSSLKKIF